MIKQIVTITMITTILSSCGNSDNALPAPDLSGIADRDHNFYNKVYNQCSINNSTNNCDCVARVNIELRGEAYDKYAAEYESIHKPALIAEIEQRRATLEEKTKNRSDERVLEAHTEDLHRAEEKLARGIDNIDDFNLGFLPAGATDHCKLTN